MGLEFALVDDATKHAYDLGRWCGYDWRGKTPTSFEEVRTYFRDFYSTDGEDDPEYARAVEPVARDVWAFVEAHPNCRLVDEHDYLWREAVMAFTPEVFDVFEGPQYCFVTVGSRYGAQKRALAKER